MDYIGARDASKKWGITPRQVQKLCENGRIGGVFRIGTVWAIPTDATKPIDHRTTAGKMERDSRNAK
jgi:hypothetical protein